MIGGMELIVVVMMVDELLLLLSPQLRYSKAGRRGVAEVASFA